MRTERCACGGVITVERADWDEIAAAVFKHNGSGMHDAWRQLRQVAP